MPGHPTPEELSGFLLGTLPIEKFDDLAGHLEACPTCQETIHNLEAHADTLLESLRRSQEPSPIDSACRQAIEKAVSLVKGAAGDADSATESVSGPSEEIDTADLAARSDASPDAVLLSAQAVTSGENPAAPSQALTVEQFVAQLKSAGILADEDWSSLEAAIGAATDGDDLANRLVARGTLTSFQAQLVAQGKTRGLLLGEYIVLDRIGAGGMGQVYKARHRRMDRLVALKVMSTAAVKDAEAVKRFQREVKTAARLIHPNIVTAFDAGQQGNVHFLVMELVDGSDLSSRLRQHGPLPVRDAVQAVLQAALGLSFAHAAGVVHRDIKPANLLLDKHGVVRILDMGLARFDDPLGRGQDDGLTHSGQVMGTVDYMAPEQAFNTRDAGQAADVYSLGCTLYRLLTGQALYGGETVVQKILAHREQPIPALVAARPEVPAALGKLYERMVAKKAEDRPRMTEVVAELERLEKVTPSSDGSRGMKPPLKRIAAGAAGFLFLLLGIWVIVRDKDDNEVGRMKIPDEGSVTIHTSGGDLKKVTQQPLQPAEGLPLAAPPMAKAPFDAAQAKAHQAAWAKHLGTQVETTNSVGMKMVLIPPGEFLMGSSDEEVAAALRVAEETQADQVTKDRIQHAERPQHRVVITKPFLMGATEVTIGQFNSFVEASKYVTEAEQYGFGDSSEKVPTDKTTEAQKQHNWRAPGYAVTDVWPVAQITWNDAVAYCNWLSAKEKVTYRLPTEAEWEYACRAGTMTQYSFGDDHRQLDQFDRHQKDGADHPHAVAIGLPNGFGLFDMHGNLCEWCQDYWNEKVYEQNATVDPIAADSGVNRVFRGGASGSRASHRRSAFRHNFPPSYRLSHNGFRIVRELAAQPTPLLAATSTTPGIPPTNLASSPQPAWTPGPSENVLPGLIPRPTIFKGLKRWNLDTVAPQGNIWAVAWSADGRRLAVSSNDLIVRIYQVSADAKFVLSAHFACSTSDYVDSLAWSPDGQSLACSTTIDGKRIVQARDSVSGNLLKTLNGATLAGGWSRDGRRFLAANDRHEVVVWTLPEWAVERTYPGMTGFIRGLAWSPDEQSLAVVSADKQCRVWGVDGSKIAEFRLQSPPTTAPGCLSWRRDGKQIAVGASDSYELFSLDAPNSPQVFKTANPHLAFFNPKFDELVVSQVSGKVFSADLASAKSTTLAALFPFGCAAWSPDGRWLACGGGNGSLEFWDREAKSITKVYAHKGFHRSQWLAEGSLLSAACNDGTVRLWGSNGEPRGMTMRARELSQYYSSDYAVSPDGSQLIYFPGANAASDRQVIVQQVLTGEQRILDVGMRSPRYFAFSPDRKHAAWIAADDRIQVFNATSWNEEHDFVVPRDGSAKALVWSAASDSLFTVGGGKIHKYRFGDKQPRLVMEDMRFEPTKFWSCSRQDSKDRILMTAGSVSMLVDLATPRVLWSRPSNNSGISDLSLDGRFAVDVHNRDLLLVDADTGRDSRRRALMNRNLTTFLSWNPDGSWISESHGDSLLLLDPATLAPQRVIVYLDEKRSATFSAAGELLFLEPAVDEHLVYIVERDDGRTELLSPSEFRRQFLEGAASAPSVLAATSTPPLAKAPFDASQAKAHQAAWAKHLGTQVETTNSIGQKMVLIPPGEFLMGSSDEQVEAALKSAEGFGVDQSTKDRIQKNERPQHKVVITKPFLTSATEVTIGQFKQFVAAAKHVTEAERYGCGNSASTTLEVAPERTNSVRWNAPEHVPGDDSAVTQVSWNDACAYCNWRSANEQLRAYYRLDARGRWVIVPDADGYRLPTEAEWEFACRAGSETQYGCGDEVLPLNDYGWSNANARDNERRIVGRLHPNAFGLFDMHGNLMEWCQDCLDPNWYAKSPTNDPLAPDPPASQPQTFSSWRVLRGGSWYDSPTYSRSAFRFSGAPSYRHRTIGFRVVRTLETPTAIPLANDPDHRAAEWVLRKGGWLEVFVGGVSKTVRTSAELPAGKFAVGSVRLMNSPVTDEDLTNLSDLSRLSQLDLGGAGSTISDRGLEHICRLPALSQLTLHATRITGAGLGVLTTMPNLEQLIVSNTQIRGEDYRKLHGLPKLRKLSIGSPGLTPMDADLEYVSGLSGLESLEIQYANITDEGIKKLRGLPNLKDFGLLNLSDKSRITGDGLAHLRAFPKLSSLIFRQVSISDEHIPALAGIKTLQTVRLDRTQVTAAGIAALHKALPNCKVFEIDESGDHVLRPVSIVDPDRRAAEWALSRGGWLEVIVDGVSKTVRTSAELPAGKFAVTSANIVSIPLADDELDNLRGLSSLVSLNLSGSGITDRGIERLRNLTSLSKLNLHNTKLTGAGLDILATLPQLDELNLAATPLRGDDFQSLRKFPRLKTLWVGTHFVSIDAGLIHIAGLSRLESLDISYAVLTDQGLKNLGGLTNLNFLSLANLSQGSALTPGGLTHLRKLPELDSLRFLVVPIGDEHLVSLAEVRSLKSVRLDRTQVTAAGVAALQKALPKLKIEWDTDPVKATPQQLGVTPLPVVVTPAAKVGRLPGPRKDILPGLISRPALLPKVRRWNIETIAPRGNIDSVAWTADGRRLAVASQDANVRIYDVGDNSHLELVGRLGFLPLEFARTLAWHPDGRQLAYSIYGSGRQEAAEVRDAETGELLRKLPDVWFLGGWTRDGRRFLTVNGRFEIQLWKLPEWTVERTITGLKGRVHGLAWSPDETRFAAYSEDKTCRVWTRDGTVVAKIDLPAAPAFNNHNGLSWRRDGRQLAVGLAGAYVLCDLTEPPATRVVVTGGLPCFCAFSPRTDELVVSQSGSPIVLGDPTKGKMTSLPNVEPSPRRCAAWSPDGDLLAIGNEQGKLWLWNHRTQSMNPVFQKQNFYSPRWINGGKEFIAVTQHLSVRTWSAEGEQLRVASLDAPSNAGTRWTVSPDGRWVVYHYSSPDADQAVQIHVLDAVAGDTRKITAAGKTTGNTAFSPDGKYVALLLAGNRLQVFSTATWQSLWDRPLPDDRLRTALVWSRDSSKLWAIGGAGMVGLSLATPEQRVVFDDPRLAPVNQNDVASAGAVDRVLVRRTDNDRTLSLVDLRSPGIVWSHPWVNGTPSLNSQGTLLAGGEGSSVVLREGATDKILVRRLSEPSVNGCDWSPDDRLLLKSDNLGTLRVIDAETFEPRRTIVYLDDRRSATFSESGDLLFPEPFVDRTLVYVVEDDDGVTTLLSPAEFRERFEIIR